MESRVEVQVSEDGLEARVCIVPGRASNREEVDTALSEAGVCKGILDDTLDSLGTGLADPNHTCRDVLVATGEPARDGTDGELDFSLPHDLPAAHVEPPAKKGKASEGYFTVVIPRQEIADYQAPRKGEPGWSVRGEVLPCTDGKDPLDLIGEGLECAPTGKVSATSVGVVIRRKGERLSVRPLPAEKRLVVTISDDSMLATVRLFPGEPGDASTLGLVLAQAGVTTGVVPVAEELLAEKLCDPLYSVDELVVAEGSEPISGADGVFTPSFAKEAPAGSVRAGKVDEKGQIDFRNRNLLQPVEVDEVLGVYTGATKGVAGATVRGEALPATAGAERMPNLGDGIDKKKAPDTIRARRAGVILYQEAKQLDVVELSEHRGDVDLTSGNLRVNGSITISGSVMSNARVEATGDVIIGGLVDGGGVASDGQVVVKGGVIGQDTAWIRSRGDASCNHTLGARIESRETLVVQKAAVNSWLYARVVSGPFKVLGGEIHAAEKIAVQEAGSPAGARTVLAVATPLPACEDDACENVHLAFEKDQAVLEPPLANDAECEAAGDGGKAADALTRQHLTAARIEIAGTVHPGVLVRIGPFSITIDEPISGVQFRFDKTSSPPIVVEPLSP